MVPPRTTNDLRKLRLRGLTERIPGSHRYRVTDVGLRVASCYSRVHRRALVPALSAVLDRQNSSVLARLVERFDNQIQCLWQGQLLAA